MAKNQKAVDDAVTNLIKIDIPAAWGALETAAVTPAPPAKDNTSKWEFIEQVS